MGRVSFDSDDDGGHHGLDGTVIEWTANGLIDPLFPAQAGQRIRVRAVNVANPGYVALIWPGMRHIGSDQGLLSELLEPASVVLAPSDRMAGAAPEPLAWPFDGAEPTPDPGWTDVLYAFHGDPHTGKWTINGESFPNVTIETLGLGEWSIIELRNISQSAHPFHLHGHAFEVLTVDGVAPAFRQLEDTLDVAPYSIVRIGLLTDNPGDWMAHCHILPHVDGGMMTVLPAPKARAVFASRLGAATGSGSAAILARTTLLGCTRATSTIQHASQCVIGSRDGNQACAGFDRGCVSWGIDRLRHTSARDPSPNPRVHVQPERRPPAGLANALPTRANRRVPPQLGSHAPLVLPRWRAEATEAGDGADTSPSCADVEWTIGRESRAIHH